MPFEAGVRRLGWIAAKDEEHAEAVNSFTVKYLNRLSDALFVMARHENKRRGAPDVLWDSRA